MADFEGTSLRRVGVRALGWQSVSVAASQIAQTAASLWVASRVAPDDFALWGIASLVLNVQYMLGGLGLGASVVFLRGKVPQRRLVDTSFLVSLALGVVMLVAALGLSRPLAAVFHAGFSEDEVARVIQVAALVLLFMTLATVPQGLMEGGFAFRRRAGVESLAAAAYVLSVIGLAAAGEGVWSLIIGRVVQAAVFSAGLWIAAPTRPSRAPRPDLPVARRLVRYGGSISVAALLGFAFGNLDTVSVGAFVGASALGAYTLAFSLANLTPTFLSLTVGKVLFPLNVAASASGERLERGYRTALHLTGIVGIGAATILMVCGPRLVIGLFGEEWTQAGDVLVVLAVYGALRALTMVSSTTLAAVGHADATVWMQVAGLVGAAAVLGPALRWEAVGIGVAFTMGQALAWAVSCLVLRRQLGWSGLQVLIGPLIAAAAGAAAAVAALVTVEGLPGGLVALAACVLVGISVLLGVDLRSRALVASGHGVITGRLARSRSRPVGTEGEGRG